MKNDKTNNPTDLLMANTANELDMEKDNSERPRVKNPTAEDLASMAGNKATPPQSPKSNHNNNNVRNYTQEPNKIKESATNNKSEVDTNNRKKQYINETLDKFHISFGRKAWTPYLTLKTEQELTAMKLDFELTKINASKEMRFKRRSPLEWTITTTTKQQSEDYLKIKKMNNINVQITRNEILNCTYGTISVPPDNKLKSEDREDLLATWKRKDRNVEDIEMYEIKNRRTPGTTIQIIKLKYRGEYLPVRIPICGEMRQVPEHTPRPMQCEQCNKFGHTKKRCKGTHRCAVCAGEHPTNWECRTTKCSNCGGEDNAKSKKCYHYEYYTQIKLLQTRTAMSFSEAKYEAKLKGYTNPHTERSYSQITQNQQTQETNQPAEHNRQEERKSKDIRGEKERTESTVHTYNRFLALRPENDGQEERRNSIDASSIDFEDLTAGYDSSPIQIANTNKRGSKQKENYTNKRKLEDIDAILKEIEEPEVQNEKQDSQQEEPANENNMMDTTTITASVHATQGSYLESAPENPEEKDFFDSTPNSNLLSLRTLEESIYNSSQETIDFPITQEDKEEETTEIETEETTGKGKASGQENSTRSEESAGKEDTTRKEETAENTAKN